jgi:hypothetical protein
MAKSRELTIWAIVGAVGLLLLLWAYPLAFPGLPERWSASREDARTLALERLRDLGRPAAGSYVVTRLEADERSEWRVLEGERGPLSGTGRDPLRDTALKWEVRVFEPQALSGDWSFRAEVTLDGRVTALERRPRSPLPGGVHTTEQARLEADYVLTEQYFDPDSFIAVEEIVRQVDGRTDRTFRYVADDRRPRHGVEVEFSGDVLVGVRRWLAESGAVDETRALQPQAFLELLHILAVYLFLPIVAVPFVRRYHAGVIGVRRGGQILVLMLGLSVLFLLLTSRSASEGLELGVFSRRQATWVWSLQFGALLYLPMALVGFLSWSVGESFCRQRDGRRLAAFDALFEGRWANATVASAAIRGTLAGLGMSGLAVGTASVLQQLNARPLLALTLGPGWDDASWMGVALLIRALVFGLYAALLGRLFLVSAGTRLAGRVVGPSLAILLGAAFLWVPGPGVLPLGVSLVLALMTTAILVVLFLAYDLLSSLLASCVMTVLIGAYPLLTAANAEVQFQGGLALFAVLLPALLSVRFLGSDEEVEYRWDEVPPHVRRIADRERLRLEVETARSIQRSILSEPPSRLGRFALAFAYEPASEVGGDFYDVVPLEDGRLAVAVGDVAGHGVSSGLVMAAVKASLGVQVTADPSVVAVFDTLNGIVFESAGRRLLTTLCYVLIDPDRGELSYASAGHLFPYRLSADGRVVALESVAYPLGVREEIEVAVRVARVESGDRLALFSDGLVEAQAPRSGEPYGFSRLEASLVSHAAETVEALRDAVLDDVVRWSGEGPRQDDLTLLILELL